MGKQTMISSPNLALNHCAQCGHADEAGAKFCGGCGISCLNARPNAGFAQMPQSIYVAPPTFPNPVGVQYAQVTPIAPIPSQLQQPFPGFSNQPQPGFTPTTPASYIAAPAAMPASYIAAPTTTPGSYSAAPTTTPGSYSAAPTTTPGSYSAAGTSTPGSYIAAPTTQPAYEYAGAQPAPVQALPNYAQVPPAPTVVLPELPRNVPPGMGKALTDKAVPSFAHFHAANPPAVNKELQAEAAKLIVLLARERLFLVFHIGLYLSLNLIALMLANKCYTEFIGDEVSKFIMAMTPFIAINVCALVCIVAIRGTRKEIARLKERISYVRFKLEFGHLM